MLAAKMAEAVSRAKFHGPAAVDRALGLAATHYRFGYEDLRSILTANPGQQPAPMQRSEDKSLTRGTGSWADFGSTTMKEA